MKYSLSHLIPKEQHFQEHRFQDDSLLWLVFLKHSDCHRESDLKGRQDSLEWSALRQLTVFPQMKFSQMEYCGYIDTTQLCACQKGQRNFSTLHVSCFTPRLTRARIGRGCRSGGKRLTQGRVKGQCLQRSKGAGLCVSGIEFGTLILPEHFHYFPHKSLCLEAQDRSKMPNEAYRGKGCANDFGRRAGARGKERGVRLQVHIFSQNHLKTGPGDANSGTHERSTKLPSGPQKWGVRRRSVSATHFQRFPLCSSPCVKAGPEGSVGGLSQALGGGRPSEFSLDFLSIESGLR